MNALAFAFHMWYTYIESADTELERSVWKDATERSKGCCCVTTPVTAVKNVVGKILAWCKDNRLIKAVKGSRMGKCIETCIGKCVKRKGSRIGKCIHRTLIQPVWEDAKPSSPAEGPAPFK